MPIWLSCGIHVSHPLVGNLSNELSLCTKGHGAKSWRKAWSGILSRIPIIRIVQIYVNFIFISPFYLDLGSAGENVKLLDSQKFVSNFSGTNVKTQLNTVSVERGMSWQQAMNKWHQHDGPDDGFYISAQVRDALVLHLQWDLSSVSVQGTVDLWSYILPIDRYSHTL